MPYMPSVPLLYSGSYWLTNDYRFPPTWPTYTPALKVNSSRQKDDAFTDVLQMANWLETYAKSLDLPIWMSSAVTHAEYDEETELWNVTVKCEHLPERIFRVRHFVLATGILGGKPKIPKFANREAFNGKVLHSLDYKRSSEYIGKKVVVVGSGTSGELSPMIGFRNSRG
jgi:cation diffusion facilitator CzcD-associated flavoprotein CzcO